MRSFFVNVNLRCFWPFALIISFILLVSGCANGPVRYKTMGRYKYATAEFPERVSWPVKPFAATCGLVTDGSIVLVDTVLIPVVSLPLAIKGAVIGPEPSSKNFKENPLGESALSALLFPIYFPWMYGLFCYFQSYEQQETPYYKLFYPGFYGEESSVYLDKGTAVIMPDVKK